MLLKGIDGRVRKKVEAHLGSADSSLESSLQREMRNYSFRIGERIPILSSDKPLTHGRLNRFYVTLFISDHEGNINDVGPLHIPSSVHSLVIAKDTESNMKHMFAWYSLDKDILAREIGTIYFPSTAQRNNLVLAIAQAERAYIKCSIARVHEQAPEIDPEKSLLYNTNGHEVFIEESLQPLCAPILLRKDYDLKGMKITQYEAEGFYPEMVRALNAQAKLEILDNPFLRSNACRFLLGRASLRSAPHRGYVLLGAMLPLTHRGGRGHSIETLMREVHVGLYDAHVDDVFGPKEKAQAVCNLLEMCPLSDDTTEPEGNLAFMDPLEDTFGLVGEEIRLSKPSDNRVGSYEAIEEFGVFPYAKFS